MFATRYSAQLATRSRPARIPDQQAIRPRLNINVQLTILISLVQRSQLVTDGLGLFQLASDDLSNQHVRDPILSSARDTITSSSHSRSASNPSATQHQRSAHDPYLIGGPFNTSEVKVTRNPNE
ncbi:hypothetical protein F2Q68_00004342 [Brassica cretica]|uniref:Uncharacterized protein n=1 Tax=Brassica cretica TaxID=69181 RepID=A0A8S9J5E7_BRACR|nr:hypothetical protein F2Q68_00004342 [Brassica cretica]